MFCFIFCLYDFRIEWVHSIAFTLNSKKKIELMELIISIPLQKWIIQLQLNIIGKNNNKQSTHWYAHHPCYPKKSL